MAYEPETPPDVFASDQHKREWERRQKKLAALREGLEWDWGTGGTISPASTEESQPESQPESEKGS